ncbi:MAG: dienelactone hydrolase family protein [Planctomycetota bacterium]
MSTSHEPDQLPVLVQAGSASLEADLTLPSDPQGIVIFAHGSGSSRKSPRNRYVSDVLVAGGSATLLFDLLTFEEQAIDQVDASLRFDIQLLTQRLAATVDWASRFERLAGLPVGLFGASTGAAAALQAAVRRPQRVTTVVSRGGRPDLAGASIPQIHCPTLLIVGGDDHDVLQLNRHAASMMTCPVRVEVVPGATHLFEEPGKLQEVAQLASNWFHDRFQTNTLDGSMP